MRITRQSAGPQFASFDGLYQRAVGFVWRRLRRLGVPADQVEDAVQEVFLAAHGRLPSFEWSPTTRAWLASAAAHVASNHRRRLGRKEGRIAAVDVGLLETQAEDGMDLAEKIDALRLMERVLAEMDDAHYTIFVLAELEQMTAAEIGEALDLNPKTVSSRLQLARRTVARLHRRRDAGIPLPSLGEARQIEEAVLVPSPESRQRMRRLLAVHVGGAPAGLVTEAARSARRSRITPAAGASALIAVAAVVTLVVAISGRRGMPTGPAGGTQASTVGRLGAPLGRQATRLPVGGDRLTTPPVVAEADTPESADRIAPEKAATHPLWDELRANPDAHPNLPSVGSVGYRYGRVPLPEPEWPVINVRLPPFGAAGNGINDDTEPLRRALAAVGDGGGIVYLPDGSYRVSQALFVNTSRTIVRGQSRTGTKILFSRPLASVEPDVPSKWFARAGGLLWFRPDGAIVEHIHDTSEVRMADNWHRGATLTVIQGDVARGARSVRVSRPERLHAGDFVMLDLLPDEAYPRDATGVPEWAEKHLAGNPSDALDRPLWLVEIARVDRSVVTLRQPLRVDLHPKMHAQFRQIRPPVEEVGVERLTIAMVDRRWDAEGPGRDGWNGVYFENALNGFVRDVTIVDADVGLGAGGAKGITFRDFSMVASQAPPHFRRLGLTLRNDAHDILFDRFSIDPRFWNGAVMSSGATGVVFSNGVANFDQVYNFPMDVLLTQMRIVSTAGGPEAGRKDRPLRGLRVALWNVELEGTDPAVLCRADLMAMGTLVGVKGCRDIGRHLGGTETNGALVDTRASGAIAVAPLNLYQAQRSLEDLRALQAN